MQICNHKVVSLQFSMSNDAGEVLDSSDDGDALLYLHGEENIVPGLELALEGKSVGDKLKVTLDAADAYGEIDPSLVEVVSAEMFEGVDNIEVGMEFEAEMPDEDELQYVRITEIDGDNVTVDGNHPLAGMRLHFDVTVEAIREATEEELEHGHVHGGECCGEEDCCN
ncbi:FKBP-type peptidyl-prolyl cis-trans isomerase [Mariprofundus ferrooxydans]|uniref:Peptidyl-prolyl cis-trans isomerase n=1 Tax=Mariprofundus ferrooxydans PV-1 TaxID=314345 RepID=Q0F1Z7_9PROT|nr:peptidylprolyl isomerase [Mariprofundus ferrooxydans]EAU55753.1 peptidyl-prolyl cis-trans isomerase, FKBP-type [Mariprofundus ferrooxydans PV-1]KON47908.1 peptidylprolyl isomerase [Mariprofundus ferrooxydans]